MTDEAPSSSSTSTSTQSIPLTPPLEALYWTQYSTWYPLFRKHAPKSTIIDIDAVQPELLDWLESETFVLPEGSGPSTLPSSDSANSSPSASGSSLDGRSNEEEEEDEDLPAEPVKLEALDRAIRNVIAKYDGGPVFPKLNWSAPLDAGFMLPGNNLQCLHPEDVYMLLKSSEFVGGIWSSFPSLPPPPPLLLRDYDDRRRRARSQHFLLLNRTSAISVYSKRRRRKGKRKKDSTATRTEKMVPTL